MDFPADLLAVAGVVRRGSTRLSRRLREKRGEEGLTRVQVRILGDVRRHGGLTPGQLAGLGRVRPQSLTRPLAALEERGLIERVRDAQDGRQSRLKVTVAGSAALAADMAARDHWLADAMARHLTRAEQQVLHLAGELMERLALLGEDDDAEEERLGAERDRAERDRAERDGAERDAAGQRGDEPRGR